MGKLIESMSIKTQQLILKILEKETPRKIILIGQSFILCQQSLDKLVEQTKNINFLRYLILAYDVSHMLGLIIGKRFTNILFHKTLILLFTA